MFAHWVELSPSLVTEKSWLSSALSASCSSSCVTCAMAGIAATATIARSAANNINFFISSAPPFSFVLGKAYRSSPGRLQYYPTDLNITQHIRGAYGELLHRNLLVIRPNVGGCHSHLHNPWCIANFGRKAQKNQWSYPNRGEDRTLSCQTTQFRITLL